LIAETGRCDLLVDCDRGVSLARWRGFGGGVGIGGIAGRQSGLWWQGKPKKGRCWYSGWAGSG